MEKYPFDATGLSSTTIDLYNDTYTALKDRFDLQHTGSIDFQLEQFEVFKACKAVHIRGSFAIKQECNNDFYILFVESVASVQGKHERADKHEYQTWVLSFLKDDFDRVLIRRETIADKLIELVHPVELDFEDDKAFSDTFYVLVNDRNKAQRCITRNFRNAVMDTRHDELVVEIIGHTLVAGSQSFMLPGTALHLGEFAERICKSC
jgi:hypothetical protein